LNGSDSLCNGLETNKGKLVIEIWSTVQLELARENRADDLHTGQCEPCLRSCFTLDEAMTSRKNKQPVCGSEKVNKPSFGQRRREI
jgi:hypothetical protein